LARTGEDAAAFVHRHQTGNWGIVGPEDRYANEKALIRGEKSAYRLKDGTTIWLLTEAVGEDRRRASTCVLLPQDY
jgi:hypothetical protein